MCVVGDSTELMGRGDQIRDSVRMFYEAEGKRLGKQLEKEFR